MIDKTNLKVELVSEYCIVNKDDQIIKDGFSTEEEAAEWMEEVYGVKHEPKSQPKISEWILCSERLPTKEEYQKNDGRFICDDGNRRYQCLFDIYDGKFKFSNHVRGLTYELIEDKCVIAWQPLPEPYKTKE